MQGVGQIIVKDRREGIQKGAKPAQGDAGLVHRIGAVVGHEEGQVAVHRGGQTIGEMVQGLGRGQVLWEGDMVCSGQHDGLRCRGGTAGRPL